MKTESIWNKYSEKQLEELESLSADYRKFLDQGKTERECVSQIVNRIEDEGYVELEKISIQYLTKHSQDHNSEKDGDEHPFHPVDRFDNFHRSQPFLLSGSARETEVIRFPGAEKRRKRI